MHALAQPYCTPIPVLFPTHIRTCKCKPILVHVPFYVLKSYCKVNVCIAHSGEVGIPLYCVGLSEWFPSTVCGQLTVWLPGNALMHERKIPLHLLLRCVRKTFEVSRVTYVRTNSCNLIYVYVDD